MYTLSIEKPDWHFYDRSDDVDALDCAVSAVEVDSDSAAGALSLFLWSST